VEYAMNDDDEHDEILNTPLIEAGALEAAAAALERAEEERDLAYANEALAKMAAILRTMLENLASLYGMSDEKICMAVIAAVCDMARDAEPDLRSVVASYGMARLELLASQH
jgi:phosphate uptake regulator